MLLLHSVVCCCHLCSVPQERPPPQSLFLFSPPPSQWGSKPITSSLPNDGQFELAWCQTVSVEHTKHTHTCTHTVTDLNNHRNSNSYTKHTSIQIHRRFKSHCQPKSRQGLCPGPTRNDAPCLATVSHETMTKPHSSQGRHNNK